MLSVYAGCPSMSIKFSLAKQQGLEKPALQIRKLFSRDSFGCRIRIPILDPDPIKDPELDLDPDPKQEPHPSWIRFRISLLLLRIYFQTGGGFGSGLNIKSMFPSKIKQFSQYFYTDQSYITVLLYQLYWIFVEGERLKVNLLGRIRIRVERFERSDPHPT